MLFKNPRISSLQKSYQGILKDTKQILDFKGSKKIIIIKISNINSMDCEIHFFVSIFCGQEIIYLEEN